MRISAPPPPSRPAVDPMRSFGPMDPCRLPARRDPLTGLWLPMLLAPARVQSNGNFGLPSSAVNVSLSAVTAGNAVIVACGSYPGYPAASIVTDNVGGGPNTYTQDYSNAFGTGTVKVFSCVNISGSPTAVNVTFPGGSYGIVIAIEVSGLDPAGGVDKTAGADSTGYDSGNTATTTVAAEYLLGVQHRVSASYNWTPGGSWGLVRKQSDTTYHTLHTQDQVVAAMAAYKSNGTSDDSSGSASIVTYKGVASSDIGVSAFRWLHDSGQSARIRR